MTLASDDSATPLSAVRGARHADDTPAYLPTLTGIRAFAALLVLILHANQFVPNPISDHVDFLHRGYLGVDLFFILSGYIIAHVYLTAFAVPSARSIGIFFWHRFIRLFPAHAVVLIGLIVLVLAGRSAGIPFRAEDGWSFADLPWYFLMVHAWGTVGMMGWNSPSWSISAEWTAYLLFPLIALGLARLPRGTAFIVALCALAVTMIAFDLAEWRIKTAWLGAPAIIRVAGEFIFGAALCQAALFAGRPGGARRLLGDLAAPMGLVGYIIAAQLHAQDFILIGLLALMLLGASSGGRIARFLFSRRPAIWLGEISYSVYIVHVPSIFVLRTGFDEIGFETWSGPMRIAAVFAAIVITISAAAVLFYLVERPVRRRLRNSLGHITTP